MIIKLAYKSLLNRKGSVALTLLAVIVSVSLLLAVEHLRKEARNSFGRSVSGVDLIVGARTGPLNLLLFSVFHVGSSSNVVSWDAYQQIKQNKNVSWAIPIMLGDSHRGAPVIGTTNDYFEHYKYADKQTVTFNSGAKFSSEYDVVIGADVAEKNGYSIGEEIILSHGTGKVSFTQHKKFPFKITGIMKVTGTPLDKALLVPLQSIGALHNGPATIQKKHSDHDHHEELDTDNPAISAMFLGLNSKIAILQTQRQLNTSKQEALSAIIPGVALGQLWQLVGSVENILRVISALVLFSALLGLATMLLASMRERQKELAVLRAIGAGPFIIFMLLQAEALLISGVGCVSGLLIVWGVTTLGNNWLSESYGLFVSANVFTFESMVILAIVLLSTCIVSFIPAWRAYRNALASGLIRH